MIHKLIALLVFGACLVIANSVSRNNLRALSIVQNPHIVTQDKRVHSASDFDLSFQLDNGYQAHQFLLRLEPNHNILPVGATVTYLDADGNIESSHPIDRSEHKVYKGTASVKNEQGFWLEVGWARITVLRDGIDPLFEGAFTVHDDSHHVQMRSSYMRTKHRLDPYAEAHSDEYMVLFRDSDVDDNTLTHQGKRGLDGAATCESDQLSFNAQFDTPVYTRMVKREDAYWGAISLETLFGKRQIDTTPRNGGNSAGVNLASTIGNSAGCPSTRKVALVGVATDCSYTSAFNSSESVRQSVISAMNSASSVFELAFNISLGLQNLTVSPADCPGTPQAATQWNQGCGANLDLGARLNLFSAWRGTLSDSNSHWTLMTNCPTGSEIGLAWLGQACVHGAYTTNTTDGGQETASGANIVALTPTQWQVIAHETGHTFGAVHDCTSQTCGDGTTVAAQQCCPLTASTCDAGQAYIMNPATAKGLTQFSACSVGNVCTAIGRNSVNTTCLAPNKGVVTITGQQCGNGIVEAGEDCDCGGVASCGNNPCCDATTCKFKTGAVCDDSNEDCCKSCKFSTNGTVCRASTGFCDPAETCTGTSPICPADNPTALNGHACTNPNSTDKSLQCAAGICTSRNYQCQTVMGNYRFSNSAGQQLPINPNNTYACNSQSCIISCTSPAFGPDVCYGLQQNFLDGTTCAGGGVCSNGRCKGVTTSGVIRSWIDDHRTMVIGIAAGVGGLLVLLILNCLFNSCRRRRHRKNMAVLKGNAMVSQAPVGFNNNNNNVSRYAPQPGAGWRPAPPVPAHTYQTQGMYGRDLPPIPPPAYSSNNAGWEMHPLQGRAPTQNGNYGGGGRGWNPPPYPPPLPARGLGSARYA